MIKRIDKLSECIATKDISLSLKDERIAKLIYSTAEKLISNRPLKFYPEVWFTLPILKSEEGLNDEVTELVCQWLRCKFEGLDIALWSSDKRCKTFSMSLSQLLIRINLNWKAAPWADPLLIEAFNQELSDLISKKTEISFRDWLNEEMDEGDCGTGLFHMPELPASLYNHEIDLLEIMKGIVAKVVGPDIYVVHEINHAWGAFSFVVRNHKRVHQESHRSPRKHLQELKGDMQIELDQYSTRVLSTIEEWQLVNQRLSLNDVKNIDLVKIFIREDGIVLSDSDDIEVRLSCSTHCVNDTLLAIFMTNDRSSSHVTFVNQLFISIRIETKVLSMVDNIQLEGDFEIIANEHIPLKADKLTCSVKTFNGLKTAVKKIKYLDLDNSLHAQGLEEKVDLNLDFNKFPELESVNINNASMSTIAVYDDGLRDVRMIFSKSSVELIDLSQTSELLKLSIHQCTFDNVLRGESMLHVAEISDIKQIKTIDLFNCIEGLVVQIYKEDTRLEDLMTLILDKNPDQCVEEEKAFAGNLNHYDHRFHLKANIDGLGGLSQLSGKIDGIELSNALELSPSHLAKQRSSEVSVLILRHRALQNDRCHKRNIKETFRPNELFISVKILSICKADAEIAIKRHFEWFQLPSLKTVVLDYGKQELEELILEHNRNLTVVNVEQLREARACANDIVDYVWQNDYIYNYDLLSPYL